MKSPRSIISALTTTMGAGFLSPAFLSKPSSWACWKRSAMQSIGARNGGMKMVMPSPSSTEARMDRAERGSDLTVSHHMVQSTTLVLDNYKLNRHEGILRKFKHFLGTPKGLPSLYQDRSLWYQESGTTPIRRLLAELKDGSQLFRRCAPWIMNLSAAT